MTDREPSKSLLPTTLWAIACVVIVISVMSGLLMTGGPFAQRAQRMDEHRTRDLSEIQRLLAEYYQMHQALPDSLDALSGDALAGPELENSRRDPVSGNPYTYRKINMDTFELCATFETDTTRDRHHPYESPYGDAMDIHPIGYYCFPLKKVPENNRPDGSIRFQKVAYP
ncbi:MAG TPA: hypothetical protein V6C52_13410 [Coleofasciculaceae cyanobacterium]